MPDTIKNETDMLDTEKFYRQESFAIIKRNDQRVSFWVKLN